MSAPQTEPINLASQLRNCVHQYARLTSQKQEEQDNSAKALKQEIIKLKEKLAQETAANKQLSCQQEEMRVMSNALIAELGEADKLRLSSYIENSSAPIVFDCGGHYGCSAVLLKLMHPEQESITFEPNPLFWQYYKAIETLLVRCAVSHHEELAEIMIDNIDGDGSTLAFDTKPVFFKEPISANKSALKMSIKCIDLKALLEKAFAFREKVSLKLDIEGAEYLILEKILQENPELIIKLEHFYCEFHGHKMTGDKEKYNEIEGLITKIREVEPWDAAPLAVYQKKGGSQLLRKYLTRTLKD